MNGRDSETICAVSTPHGTGGISVIRLSGPTAIEIGRKLLQFLPSVLDSHRVYFGRIKGMSGGDIDEVLVAYFAKGRSFTGDDTLEISCHGNPQICERILSELVAAGAKAANRGEFTYRSFLNGKVDLVQAEAVLAVIESQSAASSRLALRQLKGELSKALSRIEDLITWCLAHIEAGIDFSTEGIDVVDSTVLRERLSLAMDDLSTLLDSYSKGRLVKDGVKIVLSGRPNVGKSSLLNLVLMKERAIVSEIAGTTRDTIDGEIVFSAHKLHFFDTAGLRESKDKIESLGIRRSYEEQSDADLVLFVLDAAQGLTTEDLLLIESTRKQNMLIVLNKVDLVAESSLLDSVKSGLSKIGVDPENVISLSAHHPEARDLLLQTILVVLKLNDFNQEVLLSNSRHYENLLVAVAKVSECMLSLDSGTGPEFLALDLKEALVRIQETLGKRFDDQIMDRVFKEFCIGK